MSHSKIEMDIGLYAFNLETNDDVKKSLEKLVNMETPMEYLKIHNIMDLAKKFMMTPGVKDEARKLIAKIRRMEGVSSRAVSGSPTEQENRKRSREPTPEEMMMCSKKTAPVKYAGKKRVLDIPPEEMTLEQLQEYVIAHPQLASFVDQHFQKFVSRDFPSAARYGKPPCYTWKQHYDKFAELSKPQVSKDTETKKEAPKKREEPKEEKENKEEEKKKESEENKKLQAFLERKRAAVAPKIVKKPLLIEATGSKSAVSIRESYRQARVQQMTDPMVNCPPAKKARRRF